VLADVPLSFGSDEVYIPRNFNNRFNGPALMRQALASSLNVPAVALLYRLGVREYSDFLLRLGFGSLAGEEDAGLGLALGNTPVRLAELARAFSVFPNDGALVPLRFVLPGEPSLSGPVPKESVISRDTARIICSFLSDREARYLAFGRGRNFTADFPMIVKTGTANQYQSIVALAASRRFTAAVWMGNFSGETVIGRTGSSIPAAIARDALVFLHETLMPDDVFVVGGGGFEEPENYTKIPVCAVSGLAPTAACGAVVYEYAENGVTPAPCSWHRMENGVPVTNYPAEYQGWLLDSRRGGVVEHGASELAIVTPRDGFVFFAGSGGRNEGIPVEVTGGGRDELRVLYDGAERVVRRPFRFFLPVERGFHTLAVRCGDEEREARFTVE
jgi:penicillin-binding protein 1C